MRSTLTVLFAIALGTTIVVVSPRWFGGGGAVRTRTITYTVWGMPFEDRLFEERWARGFERAHPGIRVEYERYPDAVVKYNAWHARGWGPEVMRLPITDYHTMVRRGMLERLDPYIEAPGSGLSPAEMAGFPSMLIEALRVDGALYALPEDSAQFGLFFNKSIFDAYNAANPGEPIEYPDGSWNWEMMRTAARKLAARDERGRMAVQGIDTTIWAWPFINFFAQAGGELWSEDELTTRVDSAAGVGALEFMRALIVEDRSWKPSFGKEQGTGPEARFADGRTAMLLGGSWLVPSLELQNPDLDFGVAPAPRGRVRAIVCGCVTRAMSIHAGDKQAGWAMLRWLAEEAQAREYWNILRVAPPASIAVVSSPAFTSTEGVPDPVKEGRFLVPPMPPERFADRAEWLRAANEPDALTGRVPGFVPTGLYQSRLEREIEAMLQQYLKDCDQAAESYAAAGEGGRRSILDALDPRPHLARVVAGVHADIDRDRAAAGQAAVERP